MTTPAESLKPAPFPASDPIEVARRLVAVLGEVRARDGVALTSGQLLLELFGRGQGAAIRLSDLAKAIGVSTAAFTHQADALERAALAVRVAGVASRLGSDDRPDRRSVGLRLTSAGRQVAAALVSTLLAPAA